MGSKSLDSKVLAALHLMSENRVDGVGYMEFVKQDIMTGALDLIGRGYATRIKIRENDANYLLTPKGMKYLKKILRFASEQF